MVRLRDEWGLSAAEVFGPDGLPSWEAELLLNVARRRELERKKAADKAHAEAMRRGEL